MKKSILYHDIKQNKIYLIKCVFFNDNLKNPNFRCTGNTVCQSNVMNSEL